MLSHGASGHPDEYDEQVPGWAADGFVVASPAFPLTNGGVPGALGNVGDVALDGDLAAYEQAVAPKWFVTLFGAEHRLAFTDEPSPYDELVTRTVLDFWHGTLVGDAQALGRVTTDATDAELSRAVHR